MTAFSEDDKGIGRGPWGLRGARGGKNGREQEEGISLDGFGVADGHASELGCNLPWRPGRRSTVLEGWLEQTKFFV